ncbi:hypothetical protein ACGK9U_03570 [Mariniflexile sp. HNIBRBA6329]|uniref:hypothetical protein n=1 Tax=Mariniflexile sp. HNIBRBA6329 TaxID=3373088 RepID=UPI003745A086
MKLPFLFKITILLCLSFLFLVSCNKEDVDIVAVEEEIDEETGDKPADFAANLEIYKGDRIEIGALLVNVVNENNQPVRAVDVSAGNISKQTDDKGLAIFNNLEAFRNFLRVKVSKSNYISTSKTIIPSNTDSQIIQIKLLQPDVFTTANSGEIVSVETPSGAKVSLTGGYFNEDGTPYNGEVKIGVKHLFPEDEEIYSNIPSSLIAQDVSGQIKLLETYGMLAINLTGNSGQVLNINSLNKAKITLPIAVNQQSVAPHSIPLWYLDEEKGIWVEEGEATKIGKDFVGEVSHFSWWNCDVPLNLVNICLTIENEAGYDLHKLPISIIRNRTGQLIYRGYTDYRGVLCGVIPKNEKITINVYSSLSCTERFKKFEGVFGGYNEENNLVKIVIEDKIHQIKGRVIDCGGNGVKNGVIEVMQNGRTNFSFTTNEGEFEFNINKCGGSEIELIGYDLNNNMLTSINKITLSTDIIIVGDIKTCSGYSSTFNGDVFIYSQEELEAFSALNYTSINGSMIITNSGRKPDFDGNISNIVDNINSLESLKELVSVSGTLYILDNSNLKNLNGLDKLTHVGYLQIRDNSSLVDIKSLKSLNHFDDPSGGVHIIRNRNLKSLEGLQNVTYISGSLQISISDSLTDLMPLSGLQHVYGVLGITSNHSLKDLRGLENLTTIGGQFLLNDNGLIEDLSNLKSLKKVGAISVV